jgi:WD40 repeat protein
VRFAPVSGKDIIGCGTSTVSGTLWNGTAVVLEVENQALKQTKSVETVGGTTSVAWIGTKGDVLASAGDNAQIHVWSVINAKKDKTLRTLVGHDDVISSLSTQPTDRETLASSSWDLTLKVWGGHGEGCLNTLRGHIDLIWEVTWNPIKSDVLASASQDFTVKLWDQKAQDSTASVRVPASQFCVDWNPKDENQFVAGGDDGILRVFDMRNLSEPAVTNSDLKGQPIRRVEYSPHNEKLVAVASDSGTVSLFSTGENTTRSVASRSHFVRGLSWSRNNAGVLAIGDWNKRVELVRTQ